jgi:hypothetical protein
LQQKQKLWPEGNEDEIGNRYFGDLCLLSKNEEEDIIMDTYGYY